MRNPQNQNISIPVVMDIHDDWMRTGVSILGNLHMDWYGLIWNDIYILCTYSNYIWLVVWTPLKNISQLGWLFPIYGKIKNVPNHQPDILCIICFDQSPRFPISEQSHQGLGRPNNACIRATRGDMGTRGALRVLTPTWPRRWRPAISVGKPAKTMGVLWDMNGDLPAT